jgi:hypothetical protein
MKRNHAGFTLVEFSIATLATMILLAASFTLINRLFQTNMGMGEVMGTQANVRVAMNTISRDITMAGTGLPSGSVAIPNGTDSVSITRPGMSAFGDPERNLETPENVLPIVSTGASDGPTVATTTDVLTTFAVNPETPVWSVSSVEINTDFYNVIFTTDVYTGASKLNPGDLLLFTNNYGSVLACVTSVSSENHQLASFGVGDAMGVNQPKAENGNLGSLKNPATDPATYPPTSAERVSLVTYFINASKPGHPRLMRAVNAETALVIAEDIEGFQTSFDTWDPATETQTSNVRTTANPNQIRAVTVDIVGRSHKHFSRTNDFYRFSLVSKINVRNSSFRNRYSGS